MALKYYSSSFSKISDSPTLRVDVNYRYFIDVQNAKVWDNSDIPLGYMLKIVQSPKRRKGILEDPEFLIDMSNVVRRYNQLTDVIPTYEIGSDKNVLGQGDIIVPKIQPRMGNIFLNLAHTSYLGSSEFIEYCCDQKKVLPQYLFYVICHPTFLSALFFSESGKTHRRVNPFEFLNYKIPTVSIEKQKKAINKILTIESSIKELQSKVIPVYDIVDSVFEKEFKISKQDVIDAYKPLYSLDLSDLYNSYDFRSSFRYNSHKYDYLKNEIFRNNTFNDVIDKELTTLGRQMSPDDIQEESDFYYINTNSIKITGFDESVMTPIMDSFYKSNKQLKVEKNDILLISSGEGSIGKAAIFDSDKNCITSQFVMKLRPKVDTNILYVLYYMHSFIFQNIVEKYKKGKGNMTNIFASQLIDFPIILPSKERQITIAQEIENKISDQHHYDKKVDSLRMKIDDVISSSMDLEPILKV